MSAIEIFKKTGFENPTLMQEKYWENKHPYSILLSNTGSGKTLAFCVQLELYLTNQQSEGQVLILCPTRELATQVSKNYASLRSKGWMVRKAPQGCGLDPTSILICRSSC